MDRFRVTSIVGARPQFIKVAMVAKAFDEAECFDHVIIHTGQHFDPDMSSVFFDEMQIPSPEYNLDIHSLPHGAMTGRMLEQIEDVLVYSSPDVVVVYGDTNSTLAGAIAAKKLGLPVAHIEAGLRSYRLEMPEEVNRVLTDRISDLLFCPTSASADNLKNEGYDRLDCRVIISGDVMYDSVLHFSQMAEESSTIVNDLGVKDYLLCTIHRAENTDNAVRLRKILDALNELSEDFDVVVPLHPRTRDAIVRRGLKTRFRDIEPVGYLDMMRLIRSCSLVMTDSGGIQKEAYFHGKLCLTLRDETEWTELLERGYNILVGADPGRIVSTCRENIGVEMSFDDDIYGDGTAAKRIADELASFLLEKGR